MYRPNFHDKYSFAMIAVAGALMQLDLGQDSVSCRFATGAIWASHYDSNARLWRRGSGFPESNRLSSDTKTATKERYIRGLSDGEPQRAPARRTARGETSIAFAQIAREFHVTHVSVGKWISKALQMGAAPALKET